MGKEIEKRRRQIDYIDSRIVGLVARRARLAKEIGHYKRKLGRGLSDAGREKEVVGRTKRDAERLGLDPEFIAGIMGRIIAYCKREQRK